jgi:hypothetical protein
MKEALVELTLGQLPQLTWVFITKIADKFILGLDVLHAHEASVDLGCHVLQQGNEEIPLWCSGVWPLPSPHMKGSCGGINSVW